MVRKFRRGTYRGLGQFWQDLSFAMKNRKKIRAVMKEGALSPAFRERLMMAVTVVNGCRYCSYYHARQALLSGVSEEEITTLLSGIVDPVHDEEAAALFYAQHWAETDANPDVEARQRLVETYGRDTAGAIELALRIIRMGNLLGNTWDYFLYRISFGHWGLTEKDGHPKNA